jgi:F420-non-reducing hydrogenase iron-sulfur subunit
VSGNYKARRRVHLLKRMLSELGIEPERVRLEWVSATEGAKFARLMREFVEELRALGPRTDSVEAAPSAAPPVPSQRKG